jgi:hypothetical protein
MPKTAKKTSRTSRKPAAKKSGAKAGTTRKRATASSTGGRRGATKSRTSKSKGSRGASATKNRGVRAARGRRSGGDTLSKPLKYSKWIDSPEEHEDRNGQSLATQNHDVIRRWAEERQAVPSTVESTEGGGSAGVLRLNFPGYGGQRLQEISWDEWFGTFDERALVFLYQEHKTDGSVSNFFRLNRSED